MAVVKLEEELGENEELSERLIKYHEEKFNLGQA